MARIVTCDGEAADQVYPGRGIVAGDSLSDVLIKLYYVRAVDDFAAMHPGIGFQVYFDDIQLDARGSRAEVLDDITEAAASLKTIIQSDLDAELALDKATVTADDESLCESLRRNLGDAAGPPTRLAQFLGIDNQLGRHRKILAKPSRWKSRAKNAAARRRRLKRLGAGRSTGAVKVFVVGVMPAATYGAEVVGISTGELKQLQKTALASMAPSTRGRSKSALFTAKGDPTWRPSVAPIIRWAKEVWSAIAPGYAAAPRTPLPGAAQSMGSRE